MYIIRQRNKRYKYIIINLILQIIIMVENDIKRNESEQKMFEYYRSKRYESNMKILEILKKYFEKYPDSRFHEALIELHARNDENYDHQYFDESLQTLMDLENYLIYKQINLE